MVSWVRRSTPVVRFRWSRWAWRRAIGWQLVASVSMAAGCSKPPRPGPLPPELENRAPTAPVLVVNREGVVVSGSESDVEDRLGTIQVRLDTLAANLMHFWKTHAVDEKHGGVHGRHGREGRGLAGARKALGQQSRHLWAFATWYERRDKDPRVKAAAQSAYAFVSDHFADAEGQFFGVVSADGRTVVEREATLHAKGCLLGALAARARVFGRAEAAEEARNLLDSIDARAHDERHLGYREPAPAGDAAGGEIKSTDTHLVLLAALTELYRASPDDTVRARLEELVKLVSSTIVQPAGYLHAAFDADWRPRGEPTARYGRDLEAAWLLMDARDALGGQSDAAVEQVVLRLGKHSAELGFDAQAGGYHEAGAPGAEAAELQKLGWVQAEALAGLWWLYRLTGEDAYLDRLEKTLSWIETHQVDEEHGGWYWGVLPDGSLSPRGAIKGDERKTPDRAMRATLFVADWVAQALAESPGARLHAVGGVNPGEGSASMARR